MNQQVDDRPRVLIADDEEGLRFVLSQLLRQESCEVDLASNGLDAVQLTEARHYDMYILDMKMPRMDGLEALRRIRKLDPDALVIMITAFGTQKLAIEALQAGAYDYFTKPFELEELRIILHRALEKQGLLRKVKSLEKRLDEEHMLHRLIGQGDKMKRVFELIRRVCGHDITVLITGESGVGKELVAEAIHELGSGPEKPFVKVNCAAIPEPLLESELFGHEKGAFTGAIAAKPGKFEIAHGGSILLDEIGEMPLSLQAKILRVLQEKKIERVGDTKSRPIAVRIMAATNRDLSDMVRDKAFREDLFFRINVVPIHVPPLRERIEDLPLLVEHFIAKHTNRNGKKIAGISPAALKLMEAYAWPGNIRELENVIHRAMVMTSGHVIDVGSLPATITRAIPPAPIGLPPQRAVSQAAKRDAIKEMIGTEEFGSLQSQIDKVVEGEEKQYIEAALEKMNYRRQETADLLGISRKSLHNKMVKYGLAKKGTEQTTESDVE